DRRVLASPCIALARQCKSHYDSANLLFSGHSVTIGLRGDFFHIRSHVFIRRSVFRDTRIRGSPPVFAGLAVDSRPPVSMLRQTFITPLCPIHKDLRPCPVSIRNGLLLRP